MKIFISAIFTFILSNLTIFHVYAADPSFDCSKASKQVEYVICKSDKLARQDLKLSKLYDNILEKFTNDAREGIKQEQRSWLDNRNKVCNLSGKESEKCLLKHYRKRNSELSTLLAFDSSVRPDDETLKILRITPNGDDVPAAQQVVIQFDRPVVPIGRMERNAVDIPVEINPKLNCEWRWLNTSALACQLRNEDKMQQATRYDITISPGITTEDGVGLKQRITKTFITARPRVTYTRFVNWLSPGTPLMQLTFNQPVSKSSVEKVIVFNSEYISDDPVNIVAYPDDLPRKLPWWMEITNENAQPKVDDRLTTIDEDEAKRIWLIEPKKELPLDSSISLYVSPGLVSSEGKEAGIESRDIVVFDTYPEFEFIGIRCVLNHDRNHQDILLEDLPGSSAETVTDRCTPLGTLGLIFTAPVVDSMVKNHVTFSPALDGGRKDYDPWENTQDYTRLSSPHYKGRYYHVWLPELLQAYEKYSVEIDSDQLTDEFGRKLDNEIAFTFFTDHRRPRLVVDKYYSVLEKGVDSDIPTYVTNLDQLTISYSTTGVDDESNHYTVRKDIQKVEDISYAIPLGARELLDNKSAALYGSIHPTPTPPIWYDDPEIFVEVTPFQVHAKIGHFNSLVWVTDFANGLPIKDVNVSLYRGSYPGISALSSLSIEGKTNELGITTLPGLEQLDPDLQYINRGYDPRYPGFFLKVEKGDDFALVPLNDTFSVRGNGVYPWLKPKLGHSHAWGTTAQGIYKLGDTIEFKIYVRDQSNEHWVSPEKEGYKLEVFDPQGKVVYEQKEIKLNKFGAFDGSFSVAEQGAVGWYRFNLTTRAKPYGNNTHFTWTPMSVLVSDFTPAPFKVKTELNGELFKASDVVEISSLASMHSGGPYTDAEIRLTAKLNIKAFTTNNPLTKGFIFGSSSGKNLTAEQTNLLNILGKLDDFGQYENALTLPETEIYFGSVMVESAARDARGKFVASTARADYAGRDRFVGLKNTNWLYEKGKQAKLEIVTVDPKGSILADIPVTVSIQHREYKAARVKGPGNAYLTQNIMEWVEESTCELVTSVHAEICEFIPESPGYYQFVATIKDSSDREHRTSINGWVTGRGYVAWDQSNNANLQIVPEKNNYKVGETARYLIKNPFPGAKALITVERYGVLDSWVQTLETSTPVIDVEIKPDYLPGYYLSVMIVSPRVEKPLGEGKVDLGKPSYRMGYVTTMVSDPYKQLDIQVSTDTDVYKPRDTVKAKIKVKPEKGKTDTPYEIAVAVVDESVLALNSRGAKYYDPYAGFNKLDSLDLANYSLISRLMGRQKFEKKGANPGGDGGSAYSNIRNLFKFVSYWNPSLLPDSNGEASIEFSVPDNLTGWRILAFAVTPDDRMGLGEANIKVNRPTEIRPVMPNQIIEGDEFKAGFSVMNRTDKQRQIEINIKTKGPLAKDSETKTIRKVKLLPYKRKTIWLPVKTKGYGELDFTVAAGDQLDKDALGHKLPVNKRRSLETAATYGTFVSERVTESVKVPEGIYTDVGKIGVSLSPTVIGNIDGAFKYIYDYAYYCWEQRLTKAVFASSYLELNEYLKDSVYWNSPEKDLERALNSAANFQAPNGGMVYWLPYNSHVSPYLSAYTAIAFNWLRRDGHDIPEQVETRLHEYLLNLLRRNEFPSFYTKGISSSVRAVTLAALSESGKIDHSDIERYERHVPEMDLFGKSHFLQAAIGTENVNDDTVSNTLDLILGHASQTGGKFQFNEPWDDSYRYILATPLRSNCTILSSLLKTQIESRLSNNVGDIPFKLVRSITQSRGNRDHWENTQENVFCLNALIDYANIYEITDPNMKVSVTLADKKIGETEFSAKTDIAVSLSRPMQNDDPGQSETLEIKREGGGRLYYSAFISYDLKEDNASRINSGIEVRREYSVERNGEFELLKSPMDIKRGELVRVDLFISVPTARHFVVVNDPVPGGLEPVNTNLATASTVDANKGQFKAAEDSWFYNFSDWSYYGRYFWSFYHKELRHDSARFYSDYLPAGNYHLSYTAQAIAAGNFSVMPTHAEEMYEQDVYGKGLPARLKVTEP
ncbi:MAG: DUF1311 domain-containing protein [Proteobacteria bacterium]|nr:DUF1311 domain-containing protein [Pseudomonadota bacterium]NOG59496.1 DUF1311 domain-containing protein [Pseudomonadota bacterium]